MTSSASKDAPAYDMEQTAPEPIPEPPADEPNISTCRFCKRPSHCPNCGEHLDLEVKKEGDVNIDSEIEDIFQQLPPLPFPLPQRNEKFIHCVPPEEPAHRDVSVFLAGSIEMGKAVQWQRHMVKYLQDLPIAVYNPRRGYWNPNVTPEVKHAEFRRQVEWELSALTQANVICFFFDHETMSPVTMCELGLWAHSGKVVVCCNKRFWKGGNIHIVCEQYRLPFVQSFAELVTLVRAKLRKDGCMLDKDGKMTKDPFEEDSSKLPTLEEAESILNAAIPVPPPRPVT